MKSLYLTFTLVVLVLLSGCGVGGNISRQDFTLGKEKAVSVGNEMFSSVWGRPNMFDPNLLQEGTKEELVYAGKSGSTIKIDYRQYYGSDAGWYIKDGFTQHLEYDLSSSDLIAYKSYQIKVLTSNSSEIKFIVLKH